MKTVTTNCIKWLREYFEANGNPKAVIGISGGKDSTVVAYLCAKALGPENVIGVLMPNGVQDDIDDSLEVVQNLGIKWKKINIRDAYVGLLNGLDVTPSDRSKVNLQPRLRMATLYMVAQTEGGRVVGTGNLCERILGYFTLWGDGVSDVNPIGNTLVSEVLELGEDLGVPDRLLHKTPSDGLSGMSDEEKFGFTYKEAEAVILHHFSKVTSTVREKIERQINSNLWKWNIGPSIPCFDDYGLKWHHKK